MSRAIHAILKHCSSVMENLIMRIVYTGRSSWFSYNGDLYSATKITTNPSNISRVDNINLVLFERNSSK